MFHTMVRCKLQAGERLPVDQHDVVAAPVVDVSREGLQEALPHEFCLPLRTWVVSPYEQPSLPPAGEDDVEVAPLAGAVAELAGDLLDSQMDPSPSLC